MISSTQRFEYIVLVSYIIVGVFWGGNLSDFCIDSINVIIIGPGTSNMEGLLGYTRRLQLHVRAHFRVLPDLAASSFTDYRTSLYDYLGAYHEAPSLDMAYYRG
jgi:hypothetical protein